MFYKNSPRNIMDTDQSTQLSLFGNLSYQAQDPVRYAVEIAHAEGIAAAFGTEADNRVGTIKMSMNTEIDDVSLRLIQYLVSEGWVRTAVGAEWTVTLPPDLFPADAFTPAQAYALAFKDGLRRMLQEYHLYFKLTSKYTFA